MWAGLELEHDGHGGPPFDPHGCSGPLFQEGSAIREDGWRNPCAGGWGYGFRGGRRRNAFNALVRELSALEAASPTTIVSLPSSSIPVGHLS
jgi:hypothetical protein